MHLTTLVAQRGDHQFRCKQCTCEACSGTLSQKYSVCVGSLLPHFICFVEIVINVNTMLFEKAEPGDFIFSWVGTNDLHIDD